jgi:hypothetical protein
MGRNRLGWERGEKMRKGKRARRECCDGDEQEAPSCPLPHEGKQIPLH